MIHFSSIMCCFLQGLNILTNTCHLNTVSWYTQFTDHVASAALENEETVAVVNRRYIHTSICLNMCT